MTIQNIFISIFGVLLAVGFLVFLYFLLFKANEFNMPMAARGTGIMLLAGTLKVIFMMVAHRVSNGPNAGWLDVVLIVVAVVGMLMMMSGLAKGD